MYTRCTHCDTVFRVTPQQLQVSSGKVRCGRCNEVFDAFSSLSAQLPAAVPQEAAPPGPIESFEPPPSWTVATQDLDEPAAEAAVAEVPEPLPAEALAEEAPAEPVPAEPVPQPERAQPASAVAPPVRHEADLTLPDELFINPRPPGAHRAWSVGAALLALLMVAQVAWVFATPIAHRLPALRPALEAFCAGAGCIVALPRLPDQLFIEASDLQLLDAARPNEVLLTVTLRNRAPVTQAYPLLELTLTGVANQVASRKVFQPREYLERGVDAALGIGANQEVSIRLYLSTGTVRAAGYRLYLFFA